MRELKPLPIVFLPGLDGTAQLRAALVERVSQSRATTVIAYPDDPALDYAKLDAFVQARLPQGRFAVLGESFSGPAAIRIAHGQGDRVAGLILLSTFARNPWPRWLARLVPLLDVRICPDAFLDWLMLGDRGAAGQQELLHRVAAAMPRAVLHSRARAALRVDVSNLLAATKCPVLCLAGASDWLIERRCATHIQSLRPDCELIWLDGAHNLAMTHVDELATVIERFCASCDPSSTHIGLNGVVKHRP